MVPTTQYVEYVPPSYDLLRPNLILNKDYYGGRAYGGPVHKNVHFYNDDLDDDDYY